MSRPAADPSPEVTVVAGKGLGGALTRFRIMAYATGVVLAVMTVLLVAKWLTAFVPGFYGVGWMAHGWLYVAYVAVTLDLVFRLRWHLGRAILIMLAGTIPFMSFVAERYVTKRVKPIVAASSARTSAPASAKSAQR